ncbi:TRAPP trafficking subunit Trs65-domain-containing protein [Lentinula aff. lateritia]|uniref:TRAPP trafficking subunit Trs65-domain-containing protein n=1 Tax=Lentinula aff. lateritia TaxID=2804960 RepID=A0ACC1UGK8_9AGAR|nr:TRAPP trafficking subunit Trs65-domain-containing protein [Lentinula aff. lateritia]
MPPFEDLFTSLELDVIVPESSITYPPSPNADEWLDQLHIIDRKEAFFDEHLQTLFTLRVPQSESLQNLDIDPPEPSRNLLDFLAHVQILLEASYISPIAPNDDTSEYTVSASPLPSSRLNPNIPSSPPPRTSSIKKPTHLNLSGLLSPNSGFGSASHHPSILPPSTPNPMPASAAVDQRYLQAEGVVLTSRIWGQDGTEQEREGFSLLWSKRDRAWIAVYRTVLDIAFLRLNFDSPLLCLTFSATLRDKPLAVASSKSPLAIYLKSVGTISTPVDPISPTSPSTPVNANNDNVNSTPEIDTEISGPPEINLLAGLYAGPTFAPASSLETPTSSAMITPTPLPGQSGLPSATLSTTGHNRQHTIGGRGKPVLRKSFRKILETASGFKVRMRTVFVPAVLLDEGGEEDFEDGDENQDDEEEEEENSENHGEDEDPDRLTSGASERTVVLCVEIETEGDPFYRPADAPDFVVEKVDISITGNATGGGKEEGATARLIGWDTANALAQGAKRNRRKKQNSSSESQASFPLYLAPHEQHNLLYAVSFLHSPQEDAALDGIGSMGIKPSGGPDKSLQRGVTIEVYGKPCYANGNATIAAPAGTGEKSNKYHYPTPTFISRWNCVLDLSLSQQIPRRRNDFGNDDYDHTPLPTINALPEPPSPFPVPVSANMDSLPISSPGASTSKYTPPSVSAAITAQNLRSPTTYEAPPPPPFKDRGRGGDLSVTIPPSIDQAMGLTPPDAAMNAPPMTPAYPAFPNTTNGAHSALQPHHNAAATVPPSPLSQGPLIPHSGNLPPNSANVSGVGYVGPSVEVKRERGMGVGMGFGKAFNGDVQGGGGHDEYGDTGDIDGGNGSQSIVVSVGILPQQNIHPPKTSFESSTPLPSSQLIYPLSTFILDIFVFNRSTWTRRFEISCPDLRSRRKRREVETLIAASQGPGKRRSENVRTGMMKDLSTRTPDPGVLPLENRVRIGPLLPSACQSVRMKFLAVSPGVHSIDTLTLTDVESGLAMNLRSVMDVVVHEPA